MAFILSKHLYRNTYSNVRYHSAEFSFLLPSVFLKKKNKYRLPVFIGCKTDVQEMYFQVARDY